MYTDDKKGGMVYSCSTWNGAIKLKDVKVSQI